MRILPNYSLKLALITKNNVTTPIEKFSPIEKVNSCDTVSFGRSAGNAEALRDLMSYKIPDMYSGKIVIDPKVVERFFENKLYQGTAKSIVKFISSYESSLHSIEKEVFNMIKTKAKQAPDKKLDEIIQS